MLNIVPDSHILQRYKRHITKHHTVTPSAQTEPQLKKERIYNPQLHQNRPKDRSQQNLTHQEIDALVPFHDIGGFDFD